MTTKPTSNLQYSWSLDLREILPRDDFTIDWLSMTTDLLLKTGIGSAETSHEGVTTLHFIEVPISCLVGDANESDVIVLEITRAGVMTLAHLRMTWSGGEPTRDIAMAGAMS